MKKNILTYLFTSATLVAFGADYYMPTGTDVDMLKPESWGATEITDADTLYIQNDGTTAQVTGTAQTLTFNHMQMRGDVTVNILGSGNALVGAGTANSNIYLGSNTNDNSTLNILGYGNSYSDKTGWSLMMGNQNSSEGENMIRIHSSKKNEVDSEGNVTDDNANRFTVPSSVNSFIYNSNVDGSTAKNTISIGDNSIVDLQTNVWLGAGNDIKGGTVQVVFEGTGSEIKASNNLYLGATGSSQSGGTTKIAMGGEQNKFTANNNVNIGAGESYSEGAVQSGGTNGIYVSSTNNTFDVVNQSIYIASAWDMTGGTNEFVVSGNNNAVNTGNINVGNRNGDATLSGGINTFLISGKNNVITARNGINVNPAKQRGGSAIFEIAGSGNQVFFSSNNNVGGAMTGGEARWVLGGENNSASYVNVMSFFLGRNYAMTGGTASVEIRGKNNTATFFNVFMGNSSSTADSKTKIIVQGSGHTINIKNELNTQLTVDTGGLQFIADKDGVSTLNVFNMSSEFNGLIEIDFSQYSVKDSDNGDVFVLVSMSNNATNLLHTETDVASYFNVTGTDDYELLFGDDSLGSNTLGIRVHSTDYVIPEPSTYAAIFGALALAFVAYRRRK